MNWTPLILTFKLASVTTIALLVIGVPVAYKISQTRGNIKAVLETLVSMPLVLPPSVLGFYLLLAFGSNSMLGAFLLKHLNLSLVFSFEGLVLASFIFSFPFMVQPVQAAISQLPTSLRDAALTLGKREWVIFTKIVFPNVKRAVISGTVLSFAHTVGEFGVVLMIGGNIPGVTRVASIAIYDEVETLNYAQANIYAAILLVFSFVILATVNILNGRNTNKI